MMVALTLGQCTKDVECKGDRVCVDGECQGSLPPPVPTYDARFYEADRLARVGKLEQELKDLHAELEDATLAGPFVKLATGTLFSALAIFLPADNPSGSNVALPLGLVAAGVAVVFFIWGGVQLHLRLDARQRLPTEIETHEAQLRVLR